MKQPRLCFIPNKVTILYFKGEVEGEQSVAGMGIVF